MIVKKTGSGDFVADPDPMKKKLDPHRFTKKNTDMNEDILNKRQSRVTGCKKKCP